MPAVGNGFLNKALLLAASAISFLLIGCSEVMSREDFTARAKDKSDVELQQLIGKPASVEGNKPGEVKWIYSSRTFNTGGPTNKMDNKAVVVFAPASDGNLKVVDVRFE